MYRTHLEQLNLFLFENGISQIEIKPYKAYTFKGTGANPELLDKLRKTD